MNSLRYSFVCPNICTSKFRLKEKIAKQKLPLHNDIRLTTKGMNKEMNVFCVYTLPINILNS